MVKASKFSDAQKVFILKQGNDGVPVLEICRKAGISFATLFNRMKKCAVLLSDEVHRPLSTSLERGRCQIKSRLLQFSRAFRFQPNRSGITAAVQ